jgi:hypothetical protein
VSSAFFFVFDFDGGISGFSLSLVQEFGHCFKDGGCHLSLGIKGFGDVFVRSEEFVDGLFQVSFGWSHWSQIFLLEY